MILSMQKGHRVSITTTYEWSIYFEGDELPVFSIRVSEVKIWREQAVCISDVATHNVETAEQVHIEKMYSAHSVHKL